LAEQRGALLYYRFLVEAKALIISKILYQYFVNALFLIILFVLMNFWLPQSIPHIIPYFFTAFLFMLCCSTVFTFNSALAYGAKNSSMVALVLSMPLLIPSLLVCLKAASKFLVSLPNPDFYQDWLVLVLLLLIQLVLSVTLFNYIWKD
jgi:heme exporter protein B